MGGGEEWEEWEERGEWEEWEEDTTFESHSTHRVQDVGHVGARRDGLKLRVRRDAHLPGVKTGGVKRGASCSDLKIKSRVAYGEREVTCVCVTEM